MTSHCALFHATRDVQGEVGECSRGMVGVALKFRARACGTDVYAGSCTISEEILNQAC